MIMTMELGFEFDLPFSPGMYLYIDFALEALGAMMEIVLLALLQLLNVCSTYSGEFNAKFNHSEFESLVFHHNINICKTIGFFSRC